MGTLCGADCKGCSFKDRCKGCEATCGRPFGGTCVAAQYIKAAGKKKYEEFKKLLLAEVNSLLKFNDIPEAQSLCELPGFFVNLPFTFPSGEKIKLLDDKKVYLGTQIVISDLDICFGVAADTDFILICRYGADGSEPELIAYKKR